MPRARLQVVLALAGALLPIALACTDEGAQSEPPTVDEPGDAPDDDCTPELAGFGDAPRVEFSHYVPPERCVLDLPGREATCDVSGCSLPDFSVRISDDEHLTDYFDCAAGTGNPRSGVDFRRHQVLLVRQGTRTGEWLRPEPVVWVVQVEDTVIVAEKHEVFCLGGADINGGMVTYALVLPIETSSLAIDRRAYRSPRGCDRCDEGDCGT